MDEIDTPEFVDLDDRRYLRRFRARIAYRDPGPTLLRE